MNEHHCIDLLQRLIRTESLPGQEGDIARLLKEELDSLGFLDTVIDEAGNVVGRAPGRGSAPGLFFNTHLDHVDVGDPEHWPHPPFGGVLHEGRIHGRGAVDIKGPLAAQVAAASRFLHRPADGDVWLTAVVQEEIGGVGARELAPRLREMSGAADGTSPLVIVGEPSSNQVRRGHRGRLELVATFSGSSAHASIPEHGSNPLFALATFLDSLHAIELPEHPELGGCTLVPTLLATDQSSANVIPGEVRQTLDLRTVPGQDAEDTRRTVLRLAEEAVRAVASRDVSRDLTCSVELPTFPRTTFTGLDRPSPADNPPYLLDLDEPALRRAAEVVAEHGGGEGIGVWNFATDGGHFAAEGAVAVGLGPGDETLAHTRDEHIEVDELLLAVELYEQVARALSQESA